MIDIDTQARERRGSPAPRSVLVIGATGTQGGAAAKHLSERGWSVAGLVRDPSTVQARRLAEAGIELRTGDMADAASLRAAMAGVQAVFSVQPGRGPDRSYTPDTEVAYGTAVVDAALSCGIAHLVQMSVAGAERGTGVAFWESKRRIELHIEASGIPATLLRPAAFMENLASPSVSLMSDGLLLVSEANTRWQLIAGDDIGMMAAEAFDNPNEYLGQAIEIAGDEMSASEIPAKVSLAIGRPVPLKLPSKEMLTRSHELQRVYDFVTGSGAGRADIGALRRRLPRLRRLDDWLAEGGALQIRSAWAGDAGQLA